MGFRSRDIDDFRDRIRGTYNTAASRASRASDVLRGESDSRIFGKAVAVAIGVGVGIAIGLLIAPASGEDTRNDIADKVADISDRVRARANPQSAVDPEEAED
jgi:hypothetical protein